MEHTLSYDKGIIYSDDGYIRCPICNSKLMAVAHDHYFDVDQEAFKNGERTDKDENVPQDIGCYDIEITGRWCDECNRMIALYVQIGE